MLVYQRVSKISYGMVFQQFNLQWGEMHQSRGFTGGTSDYTCQEKSYESVQWI